MPGGGERRQPRVELVGALAEADDLVKVLVFRRSRAVDGLDGRIGTRPVGRGSPKELTESLFQPGDSSFMPRVVKQGFESRFLRGLRRDPPEGKREAQETDGNLIGASGSNLSAAGREPSTALHPRQ